MARKAALFLAALFVWIPFFSLSAAAAAASEERQALMNEAELAATPPGSEELDAYLDELLVQIMDELPAEAGDEEGEPAPADTYTQVKACYDYLVSNVSYGSHMRNLGTQIGDTTCRSIYNRYGEIEGFGAVALTAKQGLCNAYAAAFILMTRKIGLDAYLVRGETKSAGGYYTYHEWAEIRIGDVAYLFDPQLEQDLPGAYAVFFKTYDEVPGRYIRY